MNNYLDEVNKFIFQIKSNTDKFGLATSDTVSGILASYLYCVSEKNKLEKQLEHALLTGGEYLKVNEYVN